MADNNSIVKRLQNLFGIKTAQSQSVANRHTTTVPAKQASDGRMYPVNFKPELQKYYDYWLDTYDSYETIKNRFDRYKDLEFASMNSGIVGQAHQLHMEETINADENDQIIHATAPKREVEKYIYKFFNDIGVNRNTLQAVASDVPLYGDHFWALSTDGENGITAITPMDVYSVKDRVEFDAIKINQSLSNSKRSYHRGIQNDARLAKLADLLRKAKNGNDYAQMFKKYLFGFALDNNLFLPPWNMAHFRRFDANNEFSPFGRSAFINSIAPFRKLKAAENLMALARVAQFPREVFSVTVDENMTEEDKWAAVEAVREEYQMLMSGMAKKEDIGVGNAIWTIDGLLNYEVHESRMDLSKIGDVEMLRADLIFATGIPKGYFDPDRGNFGTSGQALLQQFKPFARKIFNNQTAILDELAQIVRLQFALTGDYPIETEFELSMNFPVVEESRDRLQIKNDTLRLAKDTLDNLGQAVGLDRGEALPPEVVKDVFSKLSFLSPEDVAGWVDAATQPVEGMAERMSRMETKDAEKLVERQRRSINRIYENLNEDIVRESYFRAKRDSALYEGVLANRHYLTSHRMSEQQRVTLKLLEMQRSDGRLQEASDLSGIG